MHRSRFEGETGLAGDEPPGLEIREGGATQSTETRPGDGRRGAHRGPSTRTIRCSAAGRPTSAAATSYRETRLAPGDPVTIIGRALPFSDLDDPAGADLGQGSDPTLDDPEIAADLDAARATGTLADDPAAAWGNAAIPGFGIGRPGRRAGASIRRRTACPWPDPRSPPGSSGPSRSPRRRS